MWQCDSIFVPQTTNFTFRLSVKSSPEKPRDIIVGFQTDNDGDQEQNPSIFDTVDVKNLYVMPNSTRYSAVHYNLSFPKNNSVGLIVMQQYSDLSFIILMS